MPSLILEGGGMRAGFVAGALMAFLDKRITRFDAAVAVSASVPTLAYFAAGQREDMEKVWREELCTPKLVCYKNIPAASLAPSVKRPVIDIDYLVYDVFKEKYPLDISALKRSGMDCRFAVTKVPDGRLCFLSPYGNDIYLTFKACMAVPGCYPAGVSIAGCEYMDGGTVNLLPIGGLFDSPKDRVIAILTRPLDCKSEPPTIFERTLFWRYFKNYDWMMDKLNEAAHAYNEQVAQLEQLARKSPPHIFIIAPDEMPPAKFITRSKKKINKTVDLGYQGVDKIENRLRSFLSEYSPDGPRTRS